MTDPKKRRAFAAAADSSAVARSSSAAIIVTSAPLLTDDLVEFGILARLPAKSLIRFKCVSKKWYHIISKPHPRFVYLQSKHAASCLVHRLPDTDEVRYISTHPRSIGIPAFHSHIKQYFEACQIVGSSNGLLCCIDQKYYLAYPDKIIIGNPSLNNWKLLPVNPFARFDYISYATVYGLAVEVAESSVTCKLVILINIGSEYEFHVFSSTSQQWSVTRVIQLPAEDTRFWGEVGVYVNHNMYWRFKDNSCVMWYNMESKLYGVQPLPKGAEYHTHGKVGEYGGKVSYTMISNWEVQVWSLDDQQWSKMLSIPLDNILQRKIRVHMDPCHNMLLRKMRSRENIKIPNEIIPRISVLPFYGEDSVSVRMNGVTYSYHTFSGVINKQDMPYWFLINVFPYKNNLVALH